MTSLLPSCNKHTILVDGEPYSLSERPPSNSRAVRSARAALQAPPNLKPLSKILTSIISLQPTVPIASNLLLHIKPLVHKVQYLQHATASALKTLFHSSLCAVSEKSHIFHLLLHAQLAPAQDAFTVQHTLVQALSTVCTTLSFHLENCVSAAATALQTAQTVICEMQARREHLCNSIIDLRVRNARAWETHGNMLESLTESAQLYSRASQIERQATRRSTMFSMFGFVGNLRSFLSSRFDVQMLAPVEAYVEGVQMEATLAQLEKRAVLDVKRRQRGISRSALADIEKCNKNIKEFSLEIEGLDANIIKVQDLTAELKRLGVVITCMSSFWQLLRSNLEQLCANQLVTLIGVTFDVSTNKNCQAVDEALCRSTSIGENVKIDAAAVQTIDASGRQKIWDMPCAVQRKFIIYFAQWVALTDFFKDCLLDMSLQNEMCLEKLAECSQGMSSRQTRQVVAKLCSSFDLEMNVMDEEIAKLRENLGTSSERLEATFQDDNSIS